jgi:hypothetical protein
MFGGFIPASLQLESHGAPRGSVRYSAAALARRFGRTQTVDVNALVEEALNLRLSLRPRRDTRLQQHAGSIEVDTRPGEFTEIRIILPRSAAHLSGKRP